MVAQSSWHLHYVLFYPDKKLYPILSLYDQIGNCGTENHKGNKLLGLPTKAGFLLRS